MDANITLITLGVTDLARARAFYRDGLGFSLSAASNDHIAFFRAGGVVLALYGRAALAEDARLPAEPRGAFGGFTLAHNVREREQVDAVLAEVSAVGARILKPAEDAFWGGRSGYFADPDGHPWEVAWNPHFPLDSDGRVILP